MGFELEMYPVYHVLVRRLMEEFFLVAFLENFDERRNIECRGERPS